MKYFIYTIIVLVVLAVIAGFFVVGSPQEERLRRFDERRVQDLQIIQSEIINYWQRKGILPNNLADLRDNIRGFLPPTDPVTGEQYGYAARNASQLVFTLCATFARASEAVGTPAKTVAYYEPQNWQYSAGHFCFERTIDPQLYPPVPAKSVIFR